MGWWPRGGVWASEAERLGAGRRMLIVRLSDCLTARRWDLGGWGLGGSGGAGRPGAGGWLRVCRAGAFQRAIGAQPHIQRVQQSSDTEDRSSGALPASCRDHVLPTGGCPRRDRADGEGQAGCRSKFGSKGRYGAEVPGSQGVCD